jgi:uncharacterized OsmC-like protein
MSSIKIAYLGDLRTECVHESGAQILTDAPKDNHGKGEQFSPTDLFAVSLGTCMLTIMGIAAHTRGVDLAGTTVEVAKEMQAVPVRRIAKITVHFQIPHCPSTELQKILEQAAVNCPIHYSLHPDLKLDLIFKWGG